MQIYMATVFCILTAIVVLFQLALALGAPLGEAAMGGKYPGRIPPIMRIVVLIQIMVLFIFALIVLTRVGLMFDSFFDFSKAAIWAVVVFTGLGAVLNIVTRSKWERILWAPVVAILFSCSITLATN